MSVSSIGILSPGTMGTALGAQFLQAGHTVNYASEGRTLATQLRAQAAGLQDLQKIKNLCERCTVIVSICPPHASIELAKTVANYAFSGLYCELNAISPATVAQAAEIIIEGGAQFVNGAILGPPPVTTTQQTQDEDATQTPGPSATTCYLSGAHARAIGSLLKDTNLAVVDLGDDLQKATALKMCHSAIGKIELALLYNSLTAARHYQVDEALLLHFENSPGERHRIDSLKSFLHRSKKAWRFSGEMNEVAETFAAAKLSPSFAKAAAQLFDDLAPLKDTEAAVTPASIAALLRLAHDNSDAEQ